MRTSLSIIIASIIVMVAVIVIFSGNKRDKHLMTEPLTLELICDRSFLRTVKSGTEAEKEIVLTKAAKILLKEAHAVTDNKHKDFVAGDYKRVTPVIKFMLKLDPQNGHAIYFQGEIYRLLKDEKRFIKYFERYLEIEETVGFRLAKVTDPGLCYDTPHGYCEQRTAWISQLLANYYFNKGLNSPDNSIESRSFDMALKHIHNVRDHFPLGFAASSVTMSTTELEANLNTKY